MYPLHLIIIIQPHYRANNYYENYNFYRDFFGNTQIILTSLEKRDVIII